MSLTLWAGGSGSGIRFHLVLSDLEEAAKIKVLTGLDTLLHKHELHLDDIRHALKHENELIRGQISISEDDMVMILTAMGLSGDNEEQMNMKLP